MAFYKRRNMSHCVIE